MNTEVEDAWSQLKAALRRFGALALDANHFARVVSITQHEVESLLRREADRWDDDAGWKTLLTRVGLNTAIGVARRLTERLLRDFLGHDGK